MSAEVKPDSRTVTADAAWPFICAAFPLGLCGNRPSCFDDTLRFIRVRRDSHTIACSKPRCLRPSDILVWRADSISEERQNMILGAGMVVGMIVGIPIGIAMHHLALGIGIGATLGAAFAAQPPRRRS